MEFAEDSDQYKLFSVVHVKYAGILCGLIGISVTVAAFSFGVAFFPWSRYDAILDAIALIGFIIFLASSVMVHYTTLHAILFIKFRLVMPFIVYHAFLISLNAITALIAIGELVADQDPRKDISDKLARGVLLVVPVLSSAEATMIVVMIKVRVYLRNRRRHFRRSLPSPPCEVMRSGTAPVAHTQNKVYDEATMNEYRKCSTQDVTHKKEP